MRGYGISQFVVVSRHQWSIQDFGGSVDGVSVGRKVRSMPNDVKKPLPPIVHDAALEEGMVDRYEDGLLRGTGWLATAETNLPVQAERGSVR